MAGFNLVIEGPDGAGKSNICNGLREYITNTLRWDAEVYSNPGATLLGKEIRSIVKNRKDILLDPYTEQVLFAADLCHYINSIVKPGIENNKIVISDRSNFVSGMIYGLAGGVNWGDIRTYQNISLAINPPKMHLIVLTGSYEEFFARRHHDKEGECKFESKGEQFHRQIVQYYQMVADIKSAERPNYSIKQEMTKNLAQYVALLPDNSLSVWGIDACQPYEKVLADAQRALELIMLSR